MLKVIVFIFHNLEKLPVSVRRTGAFHYKRCRYLYTSTSIYTKVNNY